MEEWVDLLKDIREELRLLNQKFRRAGSCQTEGQWKERQ